MRWRSTPPEDRVCRTLATARTSSTGPRARLSPALAGGCGSTWANGTQTAARTTAPRISVSRGRRAGECDASLDRSTRSRGCCGTSEVVLDPELYDSGRTGLRRDAAELTGVEVGLRITP